MERTGIQRCSEPFLGFNEKLAKLPEPLDEEDGGDDAAVPVEVYHDPVRLAVAGLVLDDAVQPLAPQVFPEPEGALERRADGVGLLLRGGDNPGLPVVAVAEAEFQHDLGLLLGRLHDLFPGGVEVGDDDLPGCEGMGVQIGLDGGFLVLLEQRAEFV
jgi:hypothetical protein